MRRVLLLLVATAALTVGMLPIGMSAPGNPPTPESAWTIETVGLHGGSADPHIALDSSNDPHVLFCPPGEVRYADRGETGWTSELVTSTVSGGVCGELVVAPGDVPHATTPLAVGTLRELYGTRVSGAWNLSAYPGGLLEAVNKIGEPQVVSYWNLGPSQFSFRYLSLVGGVWVHDDVETFPASGINLAWASLALDSQDTPHILYYDDARGDVRYTFRDAGGWHVVVVEHVGFIGAGGRQGDLALDSFGNPHATYFVLTGPVMSDLRYAVRTAGGWEISVLDTQGSSPVLAIGPDDLPRVAYIRLDSYDPSRSHSETRLMHAVRSAGTWSFDTVLSATFDGSTVIGTAVQFPSLTVDGCSQPHLAYYFTQRAGSDLTGSGTYYATKGDPCQPEADRPADLKREAIQRVKALKEQAIDHADWRFVETLDDAERLVWKSLGYAEPFRPVAIGVTPGPDISAARSRHDRVDLALGPSWTPLLSSYDALRVTWANGDVTAVDLPNGWPRHPVRFSDDVWIDAWEQDLSVFSSWDRMKGQVTLRIHVRGASLGFTLSLDADPVAALSFTYDIHSWWIDRSHLDAKHGHKVFQSERQAVDCLVTFTARDGGGDDDDGDGDRDGGIGVLRGDDDRRYGVGCRDRDDDDDVDDRDDDRSSGPRVVHCRLNARLWTNAERAELDAECAAIADLLVAADESLARTALDEAKDAPVRDPRNQGRVDRQIEKSERALARGRAVWDRIEHRDAIGHLLLAWDHAQHAIRIANR